ncbi:Glycine/D-amino acid oxidase [Rhizobiales bacterium GAS113]|nr:Glycine/D-amino acid oxidase [Rhizobiales bacterium GAS113]
MLNNPRSHGLWESTAPEAPRTEPLAGDTPADVVVVGAGYTGLSSALHLAERGLRVTVLEGAEIGFGGSGRNAGLVNAGMWVMPEDMPGILGPVYGERLLDLLGNAPRLVFDIIERHGIDCELEMAGTLHCGVGRKGFEELTERARQWQARGAPVELLSVEETARRVGTMAYSGSLLDRRAGTIQPLAYARGLARAAMAAGAGIFTGSRVDGVERQRGGWRVTTAKGSVVADWIVVATNDYTTAPWPEIRAELILLPYFNIATKPLGDKLRRAILPDRQGAWDTKEVLSSFRLDKSGRLIFGSVGALRGTGLPIHRSWTRRTLKRLFPHIGDFEFEAEWYGWIGMTADALPKFHRLAPKVVSISGYNGRGIAPGTVFGRILAEHIAGLLSEEDLPLPVTDPNSQSFRFAREALYEVGAQVAHLSARL